MGALTRPAAWLLDGEEMPVSTTSAPELRLRRLAGWLEELGFATELVHLGRSAASADVHARVRGRGAHLRAVRTLAAAPGLARRARRERPALVLATSALCGPAVAGVKTALGSDVLAIADVIGIRSLETSQTTSARAARPLYRLGWRGLERLLLRHVDLVLTVNEHHAGLLRHARRDAPITILRDAAESELAGLAPLPRSELGIPEGSVAVCFVGSLVCSRLEPIFTAWAQLEASSDPSRPALCLVVIGDGPDLARYLRRAASAGWLGRSVVFAGPLPRDRALAAASACDVGYSECWSETGFPLKVFEYLALGLPVVVEGKPQMEEVLRDGETALFFRDPGDLARAIDRLARDSALREQVGRAGRSALLAGHTLDHRKRELAAALARRLEPPPAALTSD